MVKDSAWELALFMIADQQLSVTLSSSIRETIKCHNFFTTCNHEWIFLFEIHFFSYELWGTEVLGTADCWDVTARTGVSEETSASLFREKE